MNKKTAVTKTLAFSTAVAALGGLLFGFDTAVIAGTTHALTLYFHLTATTLGVTVSCALWGTVFGGLFASIPGERYGGRESLRITGVLYVISSLGCAVAHNWSAFLIFRFIGGIAIGGCSVFAPMYIAETSPQAIRGKLVGCFQLCIVCGILVAYASNYAIGAMHLGKMEWRAELGVAAVPSILFFIALAFIPRSPRWLVKQGWTAEAKHSLEAIGVSDTAAEVQRILASLRLDGGTETPSVFAPAFRRPLLIALALGAFNQLSGINAILYYLNDIFARAGFAFVSASEQAVVVGLANLIFTIVGMALIDRIGRKPLLCGGAVLMAVALGGVSRIFFTGRQQRLLLPLLVLFIGSFAASQGAVVWVYLSEIFPNAIRNSGQSFASFWLWLLTATVAGLYPIMANISSGFTFLLFCLAMVVQFFVVLAFFPETRGRTLESALTI
jgi:SP family arabinose:H+ symporter-like MFS transporter